MDGRRGIPEGDRPAGRGLIDPNRQEALMYVDGFVIPVPAASKDTFIAFARES